MPMPNPFEGRRKTYSGETVDGLKKKILQHRKETHGTYDSNEFFDCAGCGVLERRLSSLESLQAKDV